MYAQLAQRRLADLAEFVSHELPLLDLAMRRGQINFVGWLRHARQITRTVVDRAGQSGVVDLHAAHRMLLSLTASGDRIAQARRLPSDWIFSVIPDLNRALAATWTGEDDTPGAERPGGPPAVGSRQTRSTLALTA